MAGVSRRGWMRSSCAALTGRSRRARWNMMMAAMEGAMAFQKGLGAVHAMSHPLGGLPGVSLHHGTLNAVVMPAVLRFNAGHVGDKYDRLAAWEPKLREMIPSAGRQLSSEPGAAEASLAETAKVLELTA